MSKQIKLFIVEGEKRDNTRIKWLIDCFLTGKYSARIITIPAAQNIFMLYEKMKEDDFDTDIVELLRESNADVRKQLEGISRQDVSEIYMFFDFDIQEDNLSRRSLRGSDDQAKAAIETMLSVFDNETENGKMYLSYPMIEAVYDYKDGLCEPYTKCFVDISEISDYKTMAGAGNPKAARHYSIDDWNMLINVFYLRLKCLFNIDELDYGYYRRCVDPMPVYLAQSEIANDDNAVFVLSALPEFLLDYFRQDFWNSRIKLQKKRYTYCSKNVSG